MDYLAGNVQLVIAIFARYKISLTGIFFVKVLLIEITPYITI